MTDHILKGIRTNQADNNCFLFANIAVFFKHPVNSLQITIGILKGI